MRRRVLGELAHQTQGEGILAAGEIPAFLGNILFYLHELKAPMQSHRCFCIGDPYGNRTHVTAVKGRCLNRLTNGPGSGNWT